MSDTILDGSADPHATDTPSTATGPVVPDPDAACWYRAATLQERIAAGEGDGPRDAARGLRRLGFWEEEGVFRDRPERVEAYLDMVGLDRDGLTALLAEPERTVRSRFPDSPPYARALQAAHRDPADDVAQVPAAEDEGHVHRPAFARVARALVGSGTRRVRLECRTLCARTPSAYIDPDTLAASLCRPPWELLASIVDRTMVLELNVARVQGRLDGETPHDRFHHFLTLLDDPDFLRELFAEYPVMARDLVRAVDNWVEVRLEFARRLVADIDAVVAELGLVEPGAVSAVSFDAGDSHRGGRSVGIITFGGGARIVYKPRPLAVERHFQDLLDWLNRRGATPPFRALGVVERDGYGWSEFAVAEPCADRDAAGRFYRRQGAFLAVLHALSATDFHWENLIAAGEHPVLVDMEALFHPLTEPPESPYVPTHALRALGDSVVGVGLLPNPMVSREDGEVTAVDISGLSGSEGQQSPTPVPTWDDPGTDEMHLVRRRMDMGVRTNRPVVDERPADVLDFTTDLLAGYQDTYRLLVQCRDELLADDGPVRAFADDEVRIILRPTRVYARLMQEGHHPDLLRDALDRDRFYGCLVAHHQARTHETEITRSELAQINDGDIPMFTTTPRSPDLVGGDGTVVPGEREVTGLQSSIDRIRAMDSDDLARQTWFLRGSLTALAMGEENARWPGYRAPVADRASGPDEFLAAARLVGDRLLETAIVDGDKIGWLGLTLFGEKVWRLSPAQTEMYNGMCGIALFLGYLGEITADRRYTEAAEKAAGILLGQVSELDRSSDDMWEYLSLGAFGELGGTMYVLSHLGALWGRDDMVSAAAEIVPYLRSRAGVDCSLDVISGSAGAIIALLALHAVRPGADVLDAAHAFGERLVDTARPEGDGLAWVGTLNPSAPLSGYSHGASGIAVALARLDRAGGTRRYDSQILGALAFERSQFDEALANWPDVREITDEGTAGRTWCHGGPGIGLARAELRSHVGGDDPGLERDLRRAAETVLAAGFHGDVVHGVGNHSICHGDLGNLECLDAVAAALDDHGLIAHTQRLKATVLRSIADVGPLCGVPFGVETPGLMSGISGIGYNLLRFARPWEVPSVLALEPPRGSVR